MSALGELGGAAEQSVGDDLGAGVAGADQAVAAALDRGHLADRVDVWDRLSHSDSRSGHRRARRPRGRPSRASSSRGRTPAAKTTSAGVDAADRRTASTRTPVAGRRRLDRRRCRRRCAPSMPSSVTIRRSSAPPPSSSCCGISRGRHSTTCGVNPEQPQRVRRLQTQQTATDHHADGACRPARPAAAPDRVEVVEGAVDVAAAAGRGRASAARTAYEPVASTSAS